MNLWNVAINIGNIIKFGSKLKLYDLEISFIDMDSK